MPLTGNCLTVGPPSVLLVNALGLCGFVGCAPAQSLEACRTDDPRARLNPTSTHESSAKLQTCRSLHMHMHSDHLNE